MEGIHYMNTKKIISSIVVFALMLSVTACEASSVETSAVSEAPIVADEVISNRLDTYISNSDQVYSLLQEHLNCTELTIEENTEFSDFDYNIESLAESGSGVYPILVNGTGVLVTCVDNKAQQIDIASIGHYQVFDMLDTPTEYEFNSGMGGTYTDVDNVIDDNVGYIEDGTMVTIVGINSRYALSEENYVIPINYFPELNQ